MATKQSKCRIIVDQFDFSGQTNGISVEMTADEIMYSVLQNETQFKIPNLASATLMQNGYYTGPDAGNLEKELYARLASVDGVNVAAIFDTDNVRPIGYVQDTTYNANLKIDTPLKNLITVDAKWPGAVEQTKRGYVLTKTFSATGGGDTVDFTLAGALGGWAFLFVTAITGTASSASIKVQSATDAVFTTPVDQSTFTFSAIGSQKLALLPTVNRYLRLNCASLGGATDFSVTAVVCVKGLTY